MLLNERLQELRLNKNISKRELSLFLNLEQSTYGKYELGQRQPSLDTLLKLASYFEVSTDYLLGCTDSPTPHNTLKKLSNLQKMNLLVSELDLDIMSKKTINNFLQLNLDERL